ncbi:hypothetical protein OSTOST_24112, partial [Ostertagia ostertagi]
ARRFFFDFVRQLSDWVQNNHALKECPKYLLGYHKVSKQEAIEVAAIILRAITKDSKNAPLAQIPQLLSELVPSDIMKMTSTSEWKKVGFEPFTPMFSNKQGCFRSCNKLRDPKNSHNPSNVHNNTKKKRGP